MQSTAPSLLSTSYQYLVPTSSVFDTMMSSTPTSRDLTSILEHLAERLEAIEARLDSIEASAGPTIAAAHYEHDNGSKSSPPYKEAKATKGKGKSKTAPAPLKAKSAKKERAIQKAANLPNPVPLHLAQMFPMEGKPNRHLITVVIPDASAQHVVGQAGKGLKQIHDISDAQVHAYSVAGSSDERHVSIRGTDLQISDALVVLGKRIARKKVRPPKMKKTGPSGGLSHLAPLLLTKQQSSSLPCHFSTQREGPSTKPRIVEVPTGEPVKPYDMPVAPTVVMASPSPTSTPIVPSITMGSPTSYTPDNTLTPMQVDAICQRYALTGQRLAALRGSDC